MPEIITCPDCDTKLKLKAALSPGKQVRCPKCSTLFAPVAEPPKKPMKSLVPKEQVDTSISKGRRNSLAEREEEDDVRPQRRRSSADEDEDSDDAGDEERPRRSRKKRPRKSGNMGLVLGLLVGGGVLLLLLVVGSVVVAFVMGRKDTYKQNEAAAKDLIACMEELATAVEGITDRNSAKAGAQRINKVCDRLEKVIARLEKMPKLTAAQDEQLKKEFQSKIDAVNQRIARVAFRAGAASQGETTFLASLQRLQQLSQRLQQVDKQRP